MLIESLLQFIPDAIVERIQIGAVVGDLSVGNEGRKFLLQELLHFACSVAGGLILPEMNFFLDPSCQACFSLAESSSRPCRCSD